MPDWTLSESGPVSHDLSVSEELSAERQMNAFLRESMADLETLYREDAGWRKVGQEEDQFTSEGRKRIVRLCRISSAVNPLLKRGLGLRVAYVWGSGVTVTVDDTGDEGQQDVNSVVQAFWDDRGNRGTFTGSQAQETLERRLGTDGETFLALPTTALTGRVQVRVILPEEIDQIICDPEDAARVWYFKRIWKAQIYNLSTNKMDSVDKVTFYPALGYWPTLRPRLIGGHEVRWDAPMLHVAVNVPERSDRGIGDVFPALPWARGHKEVLEAWILLYKALSSIAWQTKTRADKAATAARAIARRTSTDPQGPASIGTDPNTTIEAVPKTGAIIDADGGKPLVVMVAAALGVPVTMLTGDPGSTGARAVAETLDQPTELEMGLRRKVWTAVIEDIVDYVIDQAVIAPTGPLKGLIRIDDARRLVTLPEGDDRTIAVAWPEYDSVPVDVLMKALQAADSMEVLPPVEKLRLVCKYLQIPDADDIINAMTDDDGNWIPLDVADTAARDLAARQGGGAGAPAPEDPAAPSQPPGE